MQVDGQPLPAWLEEQHQNGESNATIKRMQLPRIVDRVKASALDLQKYRASTQEFRAPLDVDECRSHLNQKVKEYDAAVGEAERHKTALLRESARTDTEAKGKSRAWRASRDKIRGLLEKLKVPSCLAKPCADAIYSEVAAPESVGIALPHTGPTVVKKLTG